MNEKYALNRDSIEVYSLSNYGKQIKYPLNSCNCQYSICTFDCDCFCHKQKIDYYKKNNNTIEQTFDFINKYKKTRNASANNKNIDYTNNFTKNKKLEFSKSMDKILRNNDPKPNYIYNHKKNESKSFAYINKEISQFKDKMNKDKEYLNNIQNKLFNPSDKTETIKTNFSIYYNDSLNDKKNRKKSFSLSNRIYGYKSTANMNQNKKYEVNDYYTEKRKIKNFIINKNKFIDNNILYKKNLNNLHKEKDNNISNDIINHYSKRQGSLLSINNKNTIINNFLLNNNGINNNYEKNNFIDNIESKHIKESLSGNISKNNKDNEYIKYPIKKNIENKQNDYSNMKFLTIQVKNDKVQLKGKGINNNNIENNINYNSKNNIKNFINKTLIDNEVNNYNLPNSEKSKIKKDIIRYQIKKYDEFVNEIIYENNKENTKEDNNNKRRKITLNDIGLFSNYDIIKTKYDKDKSEDNEITNSINNKDIIQKGNEMNNKDNSKEIHNIEIKEQNNTQNSKTPIIIKEESKFNDLINKNNVSSKMESFHSLNNSKEHIFNYESKNNINNLKQISSFSINIEKKEDKNKTLLIDNLKKKILELENQLNIAYSKIKDLSNIILDIKNKNKKLFIEKIISFNYITMQNHIIKLDKRNLNNNIERKKRSLKLSDEELIIHLPQFSIENCSLNHANTTIENDLYNCSSFDNSKSKNIFFKKLASKTNNQNFYKNKNSSFVKNSIKYTKNILFNRSNNKEEIKNNISNINDNFVKDIKINEKIIYTIYPSEKTINILFFEPDTKKFSLQKFVDNNNFEEIYLNNLKLNKNSKDKKYNNGNVFLYNEGYLYAVTGKNYDMFFKFDPYKKEINKLSNLQYNHSNGNLIFYDQRIFCLSGDYNKKVECYIESKNEWIEIPEMQSERSFFSSCIIQEQYLFVLFGYNNISKQYLNSIEYIDLLCENAKWKYLYYDNNNISLFLIGALGINYDDKNIIVFGGYDGNIKKDNNYFYQINLKKNFDEENNKINNDNLSNISKVNLDNKNCFLYKGFNIYCDEKNNTIITSIDNELNLNIINLNTFSHEIYKFY